MSSNHPVSCVRPDSKQNLLTTRLKFIYGFCVVRACSSKARLPTTHTQAQVDVSFYFNCGLLSRRSVLWRAFLLSQTAGCNDAAERGFPLPGGSRPRGGPRRPRRAPKGVPLIGCGVGDIVGTPNAQQNALVQPEIECDSVLAPKPGTCKYNILSPDRLRHMSLSDLISLNPSMFHQPQLPCFIRM